MKKHEIRMTKEARSTKHDNAMRCRPLYYGLRSLGGYPRFAGAFVIRISCLERLIALTAGIVLLVTMLGSPLLAQSQTKSPLSGMLELRYERTRSGAPISVVWTLSWDEPAIADGALDYEIYDDSQLVGRFHLPDVVLSPGKNVFGAMLPSLSVLTSSMPATIHARFVTGARSIELTEQSLRVPSRMAQWFNVGVVAGSVSAPSRSQMQLADAISLEPLLPPSEIRNRSTTVALGLHSDALPADPLALCNFDVVVLLPTSLVELRDDQAEAVRKWVNAGGSVCVVAGGGLAPRHAAWINDLLAESSDHVTFVVNRRGMLSPGEDAPGEIRCEHKGFGRVVFVREALWTKLTPDAKEWRTAARFLMKVRTDLLDSDGKRPVQSAGIPQLGAFGRSGVVITPALPQPVTAPRGRRPGPGAAKTPVRPTPSAPTPARPPNVPLNAPAIAGRTVVVPGPNGPVVVPYNSWLRQANALAGFGSELAPPPLIGLDGLFQILMPRDVQMVPIGLIALILAAYVVTIGPVDYFLLGFLRLRRFTWIFFPLVTLAFAGCTLWLSRWYLGTNDSRRAVEIHDVVKGGVTARRSRIELLFLSEQREMETDVQNGTFAHVGLGLGMDAMPGRFMPGRGLSTRMDNADFSGRLPGHFSVSQAIPQWTPVANRFLSIDPKPVEIVSSPGADPRSKFDWDDPGDPTTETGRRALGTRIQRAFGNNACAIAYVGDRELPVFNNYSVLRSWQPRADSNLRQTIGFGAVLRELSVRFPTHLFALASQLSPSGGGNLEDLAVLDSSDQRQWLLVIAVEKDSQLTLYRRLYVGGW